MNVINHVNDVAESVIKARMQDLLPHEYDYYPPGKKESRETRAQRPREDMIQMYAFPQTWGSTSLGFGGMGGQSITDALTVVVFGPMGDACVYFAGRLAYHIKRPSQAFYEDMSKHRMRSVTDCKVYERD